MTMRPDIETGRQQGMVLLIALIMLLAITLMIVTASNLVQTNLKVVHNMESREQARYAALSAIEEALSSDRFTSSPGNMFIVSCEDANQKCYDTNGDGETDVRVLMSAPRCVMVSPTKNSELRPYQYPAEATCYMPAAVYSQCAESVWELRAVATDLVTGAEVVARQGVSIKTTLNNIDTACPL